MVNWSAIATLRRAMEINQEITIPAGSTLYQGHLKIVWPEYTGPVKGMFDFYDNTVTIEIQDRLATKSMVNDAYHSMVGTVIIK